MTEEEARAEAKRLRRERPDLIWSVRERAPGFWDVVGARLPTGRDRGELTPTVAPPPAQPAPQLDPRPSVRPEWGAG